MNKKNILINIIIILFFIIFFDANHISIYATIFPTSSNYPHSYISDTFPNDYLQYINILKSKHPNWIFKAIYTNLDWNTVIFHQSNNYTSGINTIHKSYSNEWKFNGTNEFADGSFVKASDTAIKYVLDPRNSLTDEKIFQFEYLGYNPLIHDESAVHSVLKNTLMGKEKIDQYKVYGNIWKSLGTTYPRLILNIGKSQNISPVHLASRIRQETSCDLANNLSINGQNYYFPTTYNFFNIKATPDSNGNNSVYNGLKYAASLNWINPYLSILGGSNTLKKYINNDQNTIYFEKFPTNNEGNAKSLLGTGYMTNIMAPINESKNTYNAYLQNNLIDSKFEFHIPIYNNMPHISLNPSLIQDYYKDNTRIYLNGDLNNTYTLKDVNQNTIKTIHSSNFLDTLPDYVIFQKRVYTNLSFNYVEVYETRTGNTYYGLINKKYIKNFPSSNLNLELEAKYIYNASSNLVKAVVKSNKPLKITKPTWKISNDCLEYSKFFSDNVTYNTTFTDLDNNSISFKIEITDIDKTPPIITVSYSLNEEEKIVATATSNEPLKENKPTWKLSDDKKTYTKIFDNNQNYTTSFSDIYNNACACKIETYLIKMDVNISYTYDENNNSVTCYIHNNKNSFKNTKPTWTLFEDNKTYKKIFFDNTSYQTLFTDEENNFYMVDINITQVDTSPINLSCLYEKEYNFVKVTISSNRKLKNTKPTWNYSSDSLSCYKLFYTNQDYTTDFTDIYNNTANYNIKFDLITLDYDITYEYLPNSTIVNITSRNELKDTKPTWNMSNNNHTYSKEFFSDVNYSTPFYDIFGNYENINIILDFKKEES